ncbi:MAG: chromosomal replication initiator protein DnaA [Deltaproteobacteria bacterium]|nr:chromosomal replication initiator protein DnaA [Deltaproteobacteria bacterium]
MSPDWTRVKDVLAERIDARDFTAWIEPLVVDKQDGDHLRLLAPNKFVSDWFQEHYAGFVHEILLELTSRKVRLEVEVDEALKGRQMSFGRPFLGDPKVVPLPVADRLAKKPARTHFVSDHVQLNPKYTFSRFIVGPSNQFAHAAGHSVARKPGAAFNPLFFYGGTGLGKTHLLHAIGHYLQAADKPTPVVLMTSERFTNELIEAIRGQKLNAFRKKFRQTTALLIDDIQFLSGKERTQEEFFHTFNELYESGAQIVLTSDRPPAQMDRLDDRLRSRFGWGLIADIQPAELETRLAILRELAKDSNTDLPEDTAMFLAEHFQINIRELEGAFIRVSAYASLNGVPISVDMSRRVLKSVIGDVESPIALSEIHREVCDYFKIKTSDLEGKRKMRNVALPRQIAGYLARELTDASFPEIGRSLGGRDHTTIMHAHRKIAEVRRKDAGLDRSVSEIERRLKKL